MKSSYDKVINLNYDSVAKKHNKSKLSTMSDMFVRNEETNFILERIKKIKSKLKILDIGCGHGYTLDQISKLSFKKRFIHLIRSS